MKVFGLINHRLESRECDGNRHGQTREIVAAKSRAEATRLFDITTYYARQQMGETGNAVELATALAEPGTIFWAPLNGPERDIYRPASKGDQAK